MKVEIEKVRKAKPFEPFFIKIQFDTIEEVREFSDLILLESNPLIPIDFPSNSVDWKGLHIAIKKELLNQGFRVENKEKGKRIIDPEYYNKLNTPIPPKKKKYEEPSYE
jgi:hypothetical protein